MFVYGYLGTHITVRYIEEYNTMALYIYIYIYMYRYVYIRMKDATIVLATIKAPTVLPFSVLLAQVHFNSHTSRRPPIIACIVGFQYYTRLLFPPNCFIVHIQPYARLQLLPNYFGVPVSIYSSGARNKAFKSRRQSTKVRAQDGLRIQRSYGLC